MPSTLRAGPQPRTPSPSQIPLKPRSPRNQPTTNTTNPTPSAPLTALEQWALSNFESHAQSCTRCNNPYQVHKSGNTLCEHGRPLAQAAGDVICSRRRSDGAVTIEVPGGSWQVESLVRAIGRSERHPGVKSIIELNDRRDVVYQERRPAVSRAPTTPVASTPTPASTTKTAPSPTPTADTTTTTTTTTTSIYEIFNWPDNPNQNPTLVTRSSSSLPTRAGDSSSTTPPPSSPKPATPQQPKHARFARPNTPTSTSPPRYTSSSPSSTKSSPTSTRSSPSSNSSTRSSAHFSSRSSPRDEKPRHELHVRRKRGRSGSPVGRNMFMSALFGGGCEVEVKTFRRVD